MAATTATAATTGKRTFTTTLEEVGEMYDPLKEIHKDHGVVFCVDTAFCVQCQPWLIKSSQRLLANATTMDILLHADKTTSVHHIAEWGVVTFQIACLRMTERFSFEERGSAVT